MPRTREHSDPTRQIYASIREDIYLAAKARAAELRLPMRRFLEEALVSAISDKATLGSEGHESIPETVVKPSIWDDQYIGTQASQPIGAPLDLSDDEARRLAREAFERQDKTFGSEGPDGADHAEFRVEGTVGDPVEISDDEAAELVRKALMLNAVEVERAGDD